jgi:succinoglycan biosynthesis transport protein ExoP
MEASNELDIGRYLSLIYKKRVLFALTAMTFTAVVVVVSYLIPKQYEAKSMVFIERNYLNELIKNVTVTPSFDEKVKALSTVIKSRSLLLKVMSDLDLDLNGKSADQIEALLKKFQDKTDVTVEMNQANRKDMDLFTVSYRDSDPKLASNYVNTLVRRYIEESLSLNKEDTYGANRFIMEQIDVFQKKIDQTEAQIAKLRKDKGVVSDGRLQLLQKRLQQLLGQYTENHPDVVKLKMEIAQIKDQVKNAKSDSAKTRGSDEDSRANGPAAEVKQQDAASVSDAVPGSAPAIPAGKTSLRDLERQRDSIRKVYEELLATLGKSEVSTQLEVQNKAGAFRILDPAVVPRKPISPNILKIILLGVLGGIAAGIGVIVGQDYLDTSVRSVEMVRKLGLPVLAVIPTIQTQQETKAIRKKDGMLYAAVGLYLVVLLAVITMEIMGLPYIGNFVDAAKTGITNSLKNTL